MANTYVLGYPQPIGAKIQLRIDHTGPASYVAFVPATGVGDVIKASDLGVGGLETGGTTFSAYTTSGTYIVQVNLCTAVPMPAGSAVSQCTLQWFTLTGGVWTAKSSEVSPGTNLASEVIRLDFTCV